MSKRAAKPRLVAPGISLHPRIAYGRPCPTGTGTACHWLIGPFLAGDGVAAIARWYSLTVEQVEAAIRWEMISRAKRLEAIEKVWPGELRKRTVTV